MKYSKWLIPAILLINTVANGQMLPYMSRSEFEWKIWESVKDEETKKQLISQVAELEDFSGSVAPIGERTTMFKAIDIDADGLPDLVYNGPQGMDKPAVIFYKNNQGEFQKIFHQSGDLIYVSREKPWNPISFQIIQKAAGGNSELQICSHSFQDGQLQFVLDNTIILRDGMKVIMENLPPMLFEIDKNEVYLRSTPGMETTNDIQNYAKGDIGFAVGSEMNSEGEIWWFVFMKEDQHKLRAGWVNSEEVKRF